MVNIYLYTINIIIYIKMSTDCSECNSTSLNFCAGTFANGVGLFYNFEPTSVTGPTGQTGFTKVILSVPVDDRSISCTSGPSGMTCTIGLDKIDLLTLDTARLANAINTAGEQLPTGSLNGYINQIFNTVGTNVSHNASTTLYITLGLIILLIFSLYAIICILLMSYSLVSIAIGVTLIFIALIFSFIVYIVCLYEINAFATNTENIVLNQSTAILDNLKCAFTSGLCCYAPSFFSPCKTCICPNRSSNAPCNNPVCTGTPCII
jgi:hypothetical protein